MKVISEDQEYIIIGHKSGPCIFYKSTQSRLHGHLVSVLNGVMFVLICEGLHSPAMLCHSLMLHGTRKRRYNRQKKTGKDNPHHGGIGTCWMAPEVNSGRFSLVKGDMWAFGMLLWEVFSLREIPYASSNAVS